jgi:hypothetical protein
MQSGMKSLKGSARPLVRFETLAGPEWTEGQVTVTPVARSLRLDVGGGIFVRIRPAAVLVSEDGRTSHLPIVDVTRWAQLAVLLAASLGLFMVWTRTRTRKERS